MSREIILTTINAKWIHPSLALRLLKANLGSLENRCEILEFALRQPLAEKAEKLEPLIAARPRILGISVSIWNHTAVMELLCELEKAWTEQRPVVVLGGPEVSHLPPEAEIFCYADYVIRGEGEIAFRVLCEDILSKNNEPQSTQNITEKKKPVFINADNVNVCEIKTAYHLYTDEDLRKKLIYVEASRGCRFNCEFCLSAVKNESSAVHIREFPLEMFFEQMDILIQRGVKTLKFLDRSFNANIKRALQICEFFLEKIEKRKGLLTIHFEMVPSLFPPELREMLARFPPGTLRLEIGIQTLNSEVSARIGRPSHPEKELEVLRWLCEKTNAIIHADLIAGLPGEDFASFGRGFDRLWHALSGAESRIEIQLGILKLLPGAPISRHNETFGMCYNPMPPYEILETSAMNAKELERLRNFARFWEIIVNRYDIDLFSANSFFASGIYENFMALSDSLFTKFGRNWGINKEELLKTIEFYVLLR
jgi:radical SAM superfamily enzyme YgiQ (UPF0313 family)